MLLKSNQENIRFKVLRLLQENPKMSQRQMSDELGVSLGKINYCVRALIEKGFIKVQNFRNSDNKIAYAYILTPIGLSEKTSMAAGFLKRKVREYELLKEEIAALKADIEDVN